MINFRIILIFEELSLLNKVNNNILYLVVRAKYISKSSKIIDNKLNVYINHNNLSEHIYDIYYNLMTKYLRYYNYININSCKCECKILHIIINNYYNWILNIILIFE